MASQARPLEFRYPASTFLGTAASGLILSGLAVAGATWAYNDPELHADWLWALIAAVMNACAAYTIVSVRLSSIWLHPDRVEHRGLLRRHEMRLPEIAGWRSGENGNVHLEDRDGRRRFTLPKALIRDPRWQDWLEGLTSLEAEEANAQFDAIQADPQLGNNAAQRLETANRAKRMAFHAFWVMLALAIWGFAFPRPYAYAMLANALAPVIALFVAWRWNDRFTLDSAEANRGGKGDLSYFLLWPGPLLAIRVMLDFDMLDWTGPILVGALGCAVAGLAAVRLHQYGRLMTIWVFVSLFGWAGGAAVIANHQLDYSVPATVRATVLESSVDDDEASVTVRTLGPEPRRISDIEVFDIAADQLPPGSHVCVEIYPGRFGWRYVYAVRCSTTG